MLKEKKEENCSINLHSLGIIFGGDAAEKTRKRNQLNRKAMREIITENLMEMIMNSRVP